MRIILIFFLIFVIFSSNNDLFAGLGNTTIGPGGFKRDIEVNEIEDVIKEDDEEDIKSGKEIKSIELDKVDNNTVGILTEEEGGLGYQMWKGSERKFIENNLKLLPINKESELAIKLMKQLLLSSASVPEGDSNDNLISIRINKLIEIGDFDNAKLLIDAMSKTKNEEILRKELEINLSLNNFDLACLDIEGNRKNFKQNLFWRKLEIFCLILNDEINKANLSLSLLKEDKEFNDENFLNIINSLIYKEEINSESLHNLDLLNLAMTRVGSINLEDNYILKDNPLLLSMIYRMPNVPIKIRIEAIEKSKKLLNLPIETIEEMYNSYEISDNDLNISMDDKILLGLETQAILFQMAIKEEKNEKKAKIIQKALDIALINGNYSLIAKLNVNSLLEVRPTKKLSWFAKTASKALFLTNNIKEAVEWFEILEKEKDKNPDLLSDFIELWSILELFKLKDNSLKVKKIAQEEIMSSILRFQSQNQEINFSTLGFYILETFDLKIDPNLWLVNFNNQQFESKQMPNTSILSFLDYSVKNNKIGETILLILISLDGRNFNEFHPFFLQIAISSLNQIGQKENAFDLALETLMNK